MNVLSSESSFHWSFPQFFNVLVAFYGGTEEGMVLNVEQLAESETAERWCTLSLTLMISRIRLVFQKVLADLY